jgi:TP901 family phage tail tape measure protein
VARTVTIEILGDSRGLEASLERAGLVAKGSSDAIGDAFNSGSTKAGNALEKLGHKAEGLGIPFAAGLSTAGKHLDEATTKTGKLTSVMGELGKATLLAGGAMAVGVGVEAVKMGIQYESAQAKIQGSTRQSTAEVKKLTSAFGGTAGQFESSGEQMEAAYAGVAGQLQATEGHALGTAEAMKVMSSATELNTAVQGNLAETTSALSAVMQAFHLSAAQASGTADTLYNVSTRLDVPIGSLATAMDKLHSRLGVLAPSLGETGGLMVALGEHGVTGSRGVQVVTSGLTKLVGGSEKTDNVLKALGVSIFNAQGKFIGINGVIAQLGPKLDELNPKQRLFAEQTLFGAGANQVLGSVMQSGTAAYQKATDAATKQGSAQYAAAQQAKTLHGELDTAKAAVETLGGDLGLVLIPKLTLVAKGLAEGITWLTKHKEAALALGAVIAGPLAAAVSIYATQKAAAFAKGSLEMIGSIGKLGTKIAEVVPIILTKMGLIGSTAQVTEGEVAAADEGMVASAGVTAAEVDTALGSTGVGLVLVGLGVAAVELEQHWKEVMSALQQASITAADEIIKALNKVKEAAEIAAEGPLALRRLIPGAGGNIAPNIPEVGQPGEGAGSARTKKAEKEISAYDKSHGIKQPIKTGQAGWLESAQRLHSLSGNVSPEQFAKSVLGSIGAPTSGSSLKAFEAWEQQEGGNWHNSAKYNPLNTTEKLPGDTGKFTAFTSWGQGLEGTLKTLQSPAYAQIVKLLQSGGSVSSIEQAINKSKWGTEFPNPAGASQRASGSAGSNAALQKMMEELAKGETSKDKTSKTTAALGIPTAVATMLSTAQALLGTKYTSGGGHGSSANDPIEMLKKIGIDCSGFVSKVLSSGGLPTTGLTTEGLASSGALAKGAGKYVTVEDRANAGGQSHALIDILGKWFESGGNPKYNPSGGVTQLTAAQARGELAGGGYQAYHPTSLNAAVSGGTTEAAINTKVEAAMTTLVKAGETLQKKYEANVQSGTVGSIEKTLGVSTTGAFASISGLAQKAAETGASGGKPLTPLTKELSKSSATSVAGEQFAALVAELKASGLNELASRLVTEHKRAMDALASEMVSTEETKLGEQLKVQATEEKDRTSQAEHSATDQLNVVKAEAVQQTDAMKAAATAIGDATQSMSDSFSALAQSIEDQSKVMADSSNAVVEGIKDQTNIEVSILGERGLYGLNLIAQKEEVQLDEMKASYDQQIAQAQREDAELALSVQQTDALDEQIVDQDKAAADAAEAKAQAHLDAVTLTGANRIQTAQAGIDAAQLDADTKIGTAELKVLAATGGGKEKEAAAAAHLKKVEGEGATEVSGAEYVLKGVVEPAANAAINAASNELATAVESWSKTIKQAEQNLARAKGEGAEQLAKAQQNLQGIEDKAAQEEAAKEKQVAITKEQATTQYAGSGLTIQQYGIDFGNATAAANEAVWALQHQLPV